MMPDQRAARFQQLVEHLEQPALGGFGRATFRLDAFSYVAIEKIDCLARGAVDRRGVLLAELEQRAERHARGDQLHAGGDRVQVVGGKKRLVAAFDWYEQSSLLQAPEQRLGHAAALRELGERKGLRRCSRAGD